MRRTVSVVVPVKDGIRFLSEVLDAVLAQGPHEVLIVDSGSTDGSVEIAAEREGVTLLEIDPASFGHGRTRNLGAASTTGDVIAFLTQDATPLPGWLEALRAGFDLGEDVGIVFGPHRPRPQTSPMIARELEAFFATKAAADGGARVERGDGDPWVSNVNAAYRRDCWEQVRFDDVPYSEDQAFGRAALAAGWAKAYVPAAEVLHAHDYPPVQFMRRYFDEYRGLRDTTGHVEGFGLRSSARSVRDLVAGDRAWMRKQGYEATTIRSWTMRAVLHHAGRRVFSALGSRAHALPAPVQRRISLEGVAASGPPPRCEGLRPPAGMPVAASTRTLLWDGVRRLAKQGPADLLAPLARQCTDAPLHIACVIPPFDRGSGGHNSIFQVMVRLERAGHTVSYWIQDDVGVREHERGARVRRDIQKWFAPIEGPVHRGFGDWFGADVVLATGWQTAHQVMLLPGCRARVYLVHDHESEFFPTSAEARWAEETYGLGMHAICSSPWLQEIVRGRYGGTTSLFDFGVDHDIYRPLPIARRRDTIVVYGRASTPRRAVPLALMALQELVERGHDIRIVSFGGADVVPMPIPHEHLGVRSPRELAATYAQATVGMVLSLTNYSLIPQEMLACGLPCVDLAGVSAEGVFGPDGPVALAPFHPIDLADTVERLLTDDAEWQRRHAAGLAFVEGRTWDVAAAQVEAGIREALRLRTATADRASTS